MKASCAADLSIEVIESKFTRRSAVGSSDWLDDPASNISGFHSSKCRARTSCDPNYKQYDLERKPHRTLLLQRLGEQSAQRGNRNHEPKQAHERSQRRCAPRATASADDNYGKAEDSTGHSADRVKRTKEIVDAHNHLTSLS